MRIKRLELVGFKSCMDRTVLEFPRGITGVVGPNGCGKSNIVDALRWVLGEQSAKHLRGQTMEDVIFAGNDRHGPLGVAEVTIVFDNEESLPHIEEDEPDDEPSIASTLRDVPEIEITRRLFRSGESEYMINGRQCRLRDITELFLGTGVGTKAYSIIEQGRVGQIVGAKPEELRLYIEEAAGTTLYRSRKLAAERKIERTRNNLLRVGDIVSELERQAASLRRQARGAVRYGELKEKEASLDRRLTAERLRRLDGHAAGIQQQLDEVTSRERALKDESHTASERRDGTRVRQRETESQTEEARRAFYDAKARLSELEQERRYLESRSGELERLCDEARTEITGIDEKLEERQAEAAAVREGQSGLSQQLHDAATARVDEERVFAENEAALFQLGNDLEDLKAGMVEALAKQATFKNEMVSVGRQREVAETRQARLKDESDSLCTLAAKLTSDVDSCQGRLDALRADLEDTAGGKESVSARLSEVLSRKGEVERQVEETRRQLAGIGSRFESLKELSENFEGYGDGVKSFMSNGGVERTGAKAVIADVIDIEDGYERAVAAVLGDRLEYVVVPNPDAGVQGAAYLRETGAGRASFIPQTPRVIPNTAPKDAPVGYSMLSQHVSAKEGYGEAIANLIDGVVVADSLERATEQWKLNGTYVTFVTRGGEVLDPAGTITGGSGRPIDEGLLARKAELRSLEESLHSVRDKARESEEVFQRVDHQARQAGEELSGLDQRLHELTVGRVGAEGDLELQRQNLARTQERAQAVGIEVEGLKQEQADLGRRYVELKNQLERVGLTLRDFDEKRAALESERNRLETDKRERGARLQSLKVREAELREKREASQVRLSALESLVDELQGRRGMLVSRLDHDEQERSTNAARLADPSMNPDRVREAMQGAEARLAELQKAAEEMSRTLADVQTRLDELAGELEQSREQRSRLELSLKECELERRSVEEGARERLGVGAEEVLGAVAECDEDVEALQAELERVRNSIHRLGTVNVSAVAELEELEGRLGELTTQRDDLEKSIEDLRGTIARLNRMSRQRFKETFDAVNAIFQDTFPKLFQGGKAWLALTDEHSLLDTGVEIFVRPPGKKVGNLNLLSGGEKALTAVSLLFSLFLHKPSPFCVLDEVDAPLDDANIGRFASMVSEMCDRSQFVLITHNKRTMESCDMLYGVTMHDPGVSKIVSVQIS